MTLPEQLDDDFRTELHQYEEEQKMPYVTSIERLARKEGRKEGRDEGREEGREEGHEEGREAGREEGRIAELLEAKFGAQGLKLMQKVRALNTLAELRRFSRFLKGAKSLDEARARLGG